MASACSSSTKEFKVELGDIRNGLLTLDLEDSDDLSELQASVEQTIFDCSLQVKKLLVSHAAPSSTHGDKGVKLPKLDVPTFDGNLLNWRTFWEQFDVLHMTEPISLTRRSSCTSVTP